MLIVTESSDVQAAVAALWPAVEAGQITFGLVGSRSAENLAAAWQRSHDYPGDSFLVAS